MWLGALALLSFGVAQAQQMPQTQAAPPAQASKPAQPARASARALTPEQQALLDKQDQQIGEVAATIVKQIDEDKAGFVWDMASPLAKQVITRDAFIAKIVHDRSVLGERGMRMPMGVRHFYYDGSGNMPKGAFINVTFDTQFTRAAQIARENVTFVLDADNIWRFVGYSVR